MRFAGLDVDLIFLFHGKENLMFLRIRRTVLDFLKREDGPTAVEYAVMLALIIVMCLTAISGIGSNANKSYTRVSNALISGS